MPNSTHGSVLFIVTLLIALVGPLAYFQHMGKQAVEEAHAQAGAQNNPVPEAIMVLGSEGPLPAGLSESEPTPTQKVPVVVTTPAPEKPSELQEIVSYITYKFEPEGKDVVVRAINCFYSESGLRTNAVGQNSDTFRSRDYGVAQLNDHWHALTEEQKTEYKANIDKAYEIYKGRGDNFSAWYGRLCN